MTVHILATGHVQGVGFRQFIKYKAKKLNVQGWVKNLPDGRVEAMLAGEESILKEMVEICKSGPYLARVKDIKVDWNSQVRTDIINFQIIK